MAANKISATQTSMTEAWVEYVIGISALIIRVFSRCKIIVGWKWHVDDYLAVLAIALFTMEVIMCQIMTDVGGDTERLGTTTGVTEEMALSMTPQARDDAEAGAKWLFASWYVYVSMIWSLKGIMLAFFSRLTKTLPEALLVKRVSVICVVAYLVTIAVITDHCRPIRRLWQVYPYAGDDCTQNISKYYALVTTNVVTDLMIIYIPIPVLWRLQTTMTRKLKFGMMFCAGGFIIICTILRCVICLRHPERLDLGLNWSIRETVVAILATNFPSIKPTYVHYCTRRRKSWRSDYSQGTDLMDFDGAGFHELSDLSGSGHSRRETLSPSRSSGAGPRRSVGSDYTIRITDLSMESLL
ncbi:hypothetical protein PG985_003001 [Apiospora marii]|uniref:Rhodopsin domain-containing protein n=1 Tax=Apiospora marii TaxID=335849 RepID=A0ABR1RUQ3_9PEZI